MQLPNEVVKNLGIKNPYDPNQNISGGCNYFKSLLNQFGSVELAIAAFNAGPEAVKKYGKIPPYAETKKFVDDVMQKYNSIKEEKTESKVSGKWVGTGKYTMYEMIPALPEMKSVVGQTQPFDLEINSDGSGVSIKTSGKLLGNPSLYKTELSDNTLHVEYSGPNPFGEQILNTVTTHTLSYTLDINVNGDLMSGEFSAKTNTKVVYNIPNLELPEVNTEINYTLILKLNKK